MRILNIGRNAFGGCAPDLHIIFRGTAAEWDAVRKAKTQTTSEVHYDNSRVGHDWAAEYHSPAWIDTDSYTVEFTEK